MEPVPADAEFYRGPIVTAALLVSGLIVGALALLADGNRTGAIDFLMLAVGLSVMAALRSRLPRGVAIWSEGMENRTGMFRREQVRWGDVVRVDPENGAVLVVHAVSDGLSRDRQIVVHGSDQLASYIGERDAASLEGPIRDALARYHQEQGRHPTPGQLTHGYRWSWTSLQLIELAVGLVVAIALGVALFRVIDLLPATWAEVTRQLAFVFAALAACAPWAMVPGWAGPRLPKSPGDLIGWRSASGLLPYMVPWMIMLAGRLAA
jgi:hypothetical protein